MNCSDCGLGLAVTEVDDGLCYGCLSSVPSAVKVAKSEASAKALQTRLDGVMLTTEMSITREVDRVAIVAGEYVVGMNIFKDFVVGVTDLVGGRSGVFERTLMESRVSVLNVLRQRALDLECDAVIAIDIKYNELTGKGSKMLFVAATGTAVKYI